MRVFATLPKRDKVKRLNEIQILRKEMFEAYLKSLEQPAAVSNNTFQIIASNSLFKDAFGTLSPGRNHLIDFIVKDDRDLFLKSSSKWGALRDGTPLDIQCTMPLKTGIKTEVKITVQPVSEIPGSNFLVTFQKAIAPKRIPIHKNDYLEGMREIHFRLDTNGVVCEINPAVLDILGYKTLDDVLGQNLLHALGYEAQSLKETRLWETLKKRNGKIDRLEMFLPKANDNNVSTECHVRYFYDQDLKIAGIEGFATDVTDNQLLIKELKETLGFTRALLKAIPTPLMYKNKDLVFEGCNQAFTDLTGISNEDIQGKSAADVWPAEFVAISEQKEMAALSENLFQIFEGTIENHNNEKITIIMVTACYPGSDGEPAGIISSFLDITARKAVELALKKQEEGIWKENQSLKKIVNPHLKKSVMVGTSRQILKLYDKIHQCAKTNMPVLIEGESGVGKELVAIEIHRNSDKKDGPIIPVNCGALTKGLEESMFFGHKKGAFTGADEDRIGCIQAADGGTLFLDEVNSIAIEKQAKLLRVLESGEVTPLGSNTPIKSNFRLISASNQDLKQMTIDGTLRGDLYYRLKGLEVMVPPLRERREDIPMLAYHFLQQFKQEEGTAKEFKSTKQYLNKDLFKVLESYRFPGNIRELRNILYQYFLTDELIINEPEKQPDPEPEKEIATVEQTPVNIDYNQEAPLNDVVEMVEKEYISHLLAKYKHNQTKVAKHLKIHRKTLYNKIVKYDI